MNSFFAEYAADSRNPRRIALGGGDRGIKTYGHEIEMYTIEQGEKRDKRQ